MACKEKPSFVVDLLLSPSQSDERRLADRFLCGTRIYNPVLADGLAIVEALRADPRWGAARRMKKGAARNEAFSAVRTAHGFTDFSFTGLAIRHKNAAGFSSRIGAHETQAIGTRVFKALEQYVFGKRGRPRFKGLRRPLHSLEGKNHKGMLRWKAENQALQVEHGWQIPVQLPNLQKDEWLAAALQFKTKYCRIVWRNIKGERRWFLQLVQDGRTPIKASVAKRLAPENSVGGLDIGPSKIAWCTAVEAGNERFADEVERPHAAIRVLRRKLDRQRRASNPDNYHEDGRVKKGRRTWKKSPAMRATERQLAEMLRYEAAVRKNAHGALINFLLGRARIWKDDGVSPLALQRRFGRSIAVRAPGLFMDMLERKAERAGGQRDIIDVYRLKTSQYDHSTDTFTKKKLSERWHVFGDGRGRAQRDIYSAFLARNTEGITYQPSMLEKAWRELASPLLVAGWYETKLQREG
ncbi:transposase [Paraburkholderia sp. UCT31]|uniref:transposase n=1 Tax=Paraburkholderia sp. UCT31 TaxID=2615209 RepID=UPI0016561A85|nr:transposase [Paraburkholderia sp. UCT31]MBC8742029.1 transposase [Paraburkholderia sp. UCT31]